MWIASSVEWMCLLCSQQTVEYAFDLAWVTWLFVPRDDVAALLLLAQNPFVAFGRRIQTEFSKTKILIYVRKRQISIHPSIQALVRAYPYVCPYTHIHPSTHTFIKVHWCVAQQHQQHNKSASPAQCRDVIDICSWSKLIPPLKTLWH